MKVNGIIAEYNPFHKGHQYQIARSKQLTGADYTIVAMSGCFMQRGTPALLDKHVRAEMALRNGADLVLELPAFYAVSSAEYFATGAVALLDRLGVMDFLCFGSEAGELTTLNRIAEFLAEEPEPYRKLLKQHLKEGRSYPSARTQAVLSLLNLPEDTAHLFRSPNNILAIEYLKALKKQNSFAVPFTVMRSGSGYHDSKLDTCQCSALAIRHALYHNSSTDGLQEQMPETAYKLLQKCAAASQTVFTNDFSSLLLYKLIAEREQGYARYADVSPELSDRILGNLYQFTDFRRFCELLKSKDMTHTRISRSLLHILLNITAKDMEQYQSLGHVPYARVLGFRKEAAPLLTAIKHNSSIPLITKLADSKNLLEETALHMLEKDITISTVYHGVAARKSGLSAKLPKESLIKNEYTTPLVIL